MWPATAIAIGMLGLAVMHPSIWPVTLAGAVILIAPSLYVT